MERIGKYQIQRVLGRGGMGTVYEVIDPLINRKVALKTMIPQLAETPDLRARFMREAQAAGGLRHRNIVTVYDLGEDKGQPFIAMEFIEGTDLEKIIQNKEPFSVEWKLDVLRQLCEGLAYAHRSGIVHRDIKPANVRVTTEGEVKIMDFGIAHLQSSTMTKSGLVLGTVHYMAPEQIEGRKVDHRADVFSVGAIAYELIGYRKPFDGDSITAVMFKIMHDRPAPEGLPKTDYSPGLEAIIMKALQKDINQRYQSLDEMHDDLERLVRDTAPRLMGRAGPSVGLIAQAKAERAAGRLEEGLRLAREAMVVAPGDGEARSLLAEMERDLARRVGGLVQDARRSLASGNVEAAKSSAAQALTLHPGDREAQTIAREVDAEALKKRVEREMSEIRAEVERARAEGHLQKALSLCKRLLELNPDDAIAKTAAEIEGAIEDREVGQLSEMALSYAADGDMELALKIAAKIGRIAPKSAKGRELKAYLEEESARQAADALTNTAREHLGLGNLDEARAAAEEALAVFPTHPVAREIRDRATDILAKQRVDQPAPRTDEDVAVPRTEEMAIPAFAQERALPGSATPAPAPPSVVTKPAPPVAPAAKPAPAPAPRPPVAPAPAAASKVPTKTPVPRSAELPPTVQMPALSTPAPAKPPTPDRPGPVRPAHTAAAPPATKPAPRPAPAAPAHRPESAAPIAKPEPVAPPSPVEPVVASSPAAETPRAAPTPPPAPKPVSEPIGVPIATLPGIVLAPGVVDGSPEAKKAEVEALVSAALNHFLMSNLGKARRAVEKALLLDPDNKKAKDLLKRVGPA